MKKIFIKLLIKSVNKKLFLFGIILSLGSSLLALLIPTLIGKILDNNFIDTILNKPTEIVTFLLIFISIYFLQTVASFIIFSAGGNSVNKIQKQVYSFILKSNLSQLNEFKPGDLASRFTNDMSVILRFLTFSIPSIFKNFIMIIGSLYFLIKISLPMTLLSISILPILLILTSVINHKLEKYYFKIQETQGEISNTISHRLHSIKLIKAFLGEHEEEVRSNQLFNKLLSSYRNIVLISGIREAGLNSLIMSFIFIVIIIAGWQVKLGVITIGILLSFIMYIFQLIEPVTDLLTVATEWAEFKSVSNRVAELLELPKEEITNCSQKLQNFDIKFHDLNFSYNTRPILTNINLTIPSGKHFAIVGPSGAGKSTIFALLLKYYNNYEGRITIGNQDLQDLSVTQLRSFIAYVPQENTLFNGTIKENLCYGKNKDITEEHLSFVLKTLQLDSLILKLEKGLETKISSQGLGLSEGQKQRFNIARALLRNSAIYLIDEPTSSLDSVTETITNRGIDTLTKGKTRITIAHRLNTIKSADYILVLNKEGKVVDSGKHEILLKNCSVYQKLVQNFD